MSVLRVCLECADGQGRLGSHGLGPEPEKRLVEGSERRPVAVLEHRDEGGADEIGGRRSGVAGRKEPEPVEDSRALARCLTENAAARSEPANNLPAAQQRGQRPAQLLRGEGIRLEERELPPVERLSEIAVVVRRREPLAQPSGPLGANRSSRTPSPGGAVAAIGSTGRIP